MVPIFAKAKDRAGR